MTGEIVSRSEWGARPRKGTASSLTSNLATIHWEGPKMGTFSHAKCAEKVRSIQRYHMDTKGWTDIAYSAVVCPHGSVFAGRGPGVRTGANGTNTGNASAYAVCALVGEGDPITTDLLDGIAAAVAWLGCTRTNAHRDWKPTACPGDVLTGHAHTGRFLHATPQPEEFTMDAEAKAAFAALDAKLGTVEAKVDRVIASERTDTARQLESVRGIRKLLVKAGLAKPKP